MINLFLTVKQDVNFLNIVRCVQVLSSDELLGEREETIQSLTAQARGLERRVRELSSDLAAAKEDLRRTEEKER